MEFRAANGSRRPSRSGSSRYLLAPDNDRRGLAAAREVHVDENRIVGWSRHVAHQIQLASGVGIVAMDRRWNPAALDAEQTADQLHRAAAGDRISHVPFERDDRDASGTEHARDRLRLGQIGRDRRRAVGIDVADVFRFQPRVAQGRRRAISTPIPSGSRPPEGCASQPEPKPRNSP